MSEEATTPYSNRVSILAEFWLDLRDDYEELIAYGDLGFPLAYAISEGIVESTPLAEEYINEIWELLLGTLRVEDSGFDTLMDIWDSPKVEPEDN
jgi:hypothetical protein